MPGSFACQFGCGAPWMIWFQGIGWRKVWDGPEGGEDTEANDRRKALLKLSKSQLSCGYRYVWTIWPSIQYVCEKGSTSAYCISPIIKWCSIMLISPWRTLVFSHSLNVVPSRHNSGREAEILITKSSSSSNTTSNSSKWMVHRLRWLEWPENNNEHRPTWQARWKSAQAWSKILNLRFVPEVENSVAIPAWGSGRDIVSINWRVRELSRGADLNKAQFEFFNARFLFPEWNVTLTVTPTSKFRISVWQ